MLKAKKKRRCTQKLIEYVSDLTQILYEQCIDDAAESLAVDAQTKANPYKNMPLLMEVREKAQTLYKERMVQFADQTLCDIVLLHEKNKVPCSPALLENIKAEMTRRGLLNDSSELRNK